MPRAMIASSADCSSSNTRAGPVMASFLSPVIFATAPSGERFPFRMARCPCAYIGLAIGRMTSWSGRGSVGTPASVCATVFPVIVTESPCSRPAPSRIFITCGMPPARCRSTVRYLPEGLRSHSTGTLLRTRSKSSIVHSTPAACAMARKCSTALVEPPIAMTTAIAFSIASRVTMSRGLRSFFTASTSTRADSRVERTFSSCGFAIVDENGRLMPSASKAALIVLAEYMPPLDLAEVGLVHAPGREFADRLEDADDVQVLAAVVPGQDRAAVDVDRRDVGAQHAHHPAGHVLVAATEDEDAVHPLRTDTGLDAVGDDLARHE